MNNTPKRAEDILNLSVNGFHQYIFDDTEHLCFVSKNFCDMTGYREDELLDESVDLYSQIIHPEDLNIYSSLIEKVRGGKSACGKYHLVKKDNNVIYVSDT